MAKTLFRLAWIISLPVRRLPVMLPRRRHLAWFIPDSLSGFFSSVGRRERGVTRVTARNKPTASGYYADEKNLPIFLRLLLLLSAAGLSFAAQAEDVRWARPVIYPQGSKQTSLPIINSSASNVFNSVMGRQCRWFTLDGLYHYAASLCDPA